MKLKLFLICFSCIALPAHADCPSWPTSQRFSLNAAEVTDLRTGLTWRRCIEGQSWSGNTCESNGTQYYTHKTALSLAKMANPSASATGWRLPNIKELASLADKGCGNPAIDQAAFPNSSGDQFWSSTPNLDAPGNAWTVNFFFGSVGYGNNGSTEYSVRLVRSSQ